MREMITYAGQSGKFNFRVAGVAFDRTGERVLIHRAITEPFWTLPGGRVEMREAAGAALVREMLEELHVEVKIERLLWLVENFFEYEGKPWHEIAFYFLMTFPPDCLLYDHSEPFSGDEEGIELIFQWQAIDTLEQRYLLPSFLGASLKSLPDGVEHLVHTDTLL
ncbi:MAG: NUDIX hydrolase [Chloroflexota bacterium]